MPRCQPSEAALRLSSSAWLARRIEENRPVVPRQPPGDTGGTLLMVGKRRIVERLLVLGSSISDEMASRKELHDLHDECILSSCGLQGRFSRSFGGWRGSFPLCSSPVQGRPARRRCCDISIRAPPT